MMSDTGTYVSLDVKAVSDTGEFEGYASTYAVDQGNDAVLPGAFAKSLATRPAGRIKMLRDHDPRQLIGQWTDAKEDDRGLWVKGRLLLDVAAAKEAYVLLKAGALDGLSIGFRSIRDRWDSAKKVRFLEEVDLREISLTAFPMNESAAVQAVKNEEFAQRVVAAINRAHARIRAA
ncbi:HK97 family phage prohead protease [Mesorhizobium sp. LHD-90]|uniref:HK97 family phage prohead protease n=1 Tax=Mesorhizobium sp. LHD-90 TaxID=3071414 RepID=UPI0027DF0792|nr:HK97 family phage prohead protease [Mesorhizobium sp. LHD-90]MDQ6434380.1 HK97 family phage prohead protease [Mesorhizobium sp. LHD-90]